MIQPHVQLRNALLDDHVKKGWVDADMFLAYCLMLRNCDWATGVWIGSADALAALSGGQWSKPTAVRILRRLRLSVVILRPTTWIKSGGTIPSASTTSSPPQARILARNYAPPRLGIIGSGSPVTLIRGPQIRITSDPVQSHP
jgi:hypothetical protein